MDLSDYEGAAYLDYDYDYDYGYDYLDYIYGGVTVMVVLMMLMTAQENDLCVRDRLQSLPFPPC